MGLLEVRGFGVGCEEHSKAGVDYTSLNLVSISEHFCRWPQKQVAKIVQCGLSRLHAALVGAYAPMLAIQGEWAD